MAHRRSPQADSDLDDIWYYIASQSASLEIADRVVHSITNRFLLLSKFPELGRTRDNDLRPGLRSFSVGGYVILYEVQGDVLILRVLRGSRNIASLFKV